MLHARMRHARRDNHVRRREVKLFRVYTRHEVLITYSSYSRQDDFGICRAVKHTCKNNEPSEISVNIIIEKKGKLPERTVYIPTNDGKFPTWSVRGREGG